MTADAILLRPLRPVLARRVGLVVTLGLLLVAGLSGLALQRASQRQANATNVAAKVPELYGHPIDRNMLMPAGRLDFHPLAGSARLDADTLFDAAGQERMAQWSLLLREHPERRAVLTVHSAPGSDRESAHRAGAAVMRLLAGDTLDAHRLQLVLARDGDSGSAALSPGDFTVTLETASP